MHEMDIEKLKALALAAASNVWYGEWEILDGISSDKAARLIAACSPAAVLELIAEVERLRVDAERYRFVRAKLSRYEFDYLLLEGEPESDMDEYCDAAIESHTKAGKDGA
jgi:hypothetical protein